MYSCLSPLAVLAGKDSIQVRLILAERNISRASTSEPGLWGTRKDYRGFVMPGAGTFVISYHRKAGFIVGLVLDV